MTEQQLIDAGYKRCNHTEVSFPYADFFYQKRIRDARGIKYFIEFVHYAPMDFKNNNIAPESWTLNWNNNEPHYTFQAHKVDGSIGIYESMIDRLWLSLGCEYYELNDGSRPKSE